MNEFLLFCTLKVDRGLRGQSMHLFIDSLIDICKFLCSNVLSPQLYCRLWGDKGLI